MSDSPFFRVGIEKALGMKATVRNATTVAKLVERYPMRRQMTGGKRQAGERPGRRAT